VPKYTSSYIIKRLIKNHIRPYYPKISLAVFFMVIVAACSAILVKMVKPAFDGIISMQNHKMLFILPSMMLLVSITKGIAEFFQNYLIKSVGQKILTDLQILLFRHLLYSDLTLMQQESSGKLISRFTNDINLMRGSVSYLIVGIAKHLLTVIFLIFLMFSLETTLSFIIFIVFPLAIYPIQKIGRSMRKTVYQTQDKLAEYTAKLDEVFLSIKVVKSYHGEEFEVAKAQKMTDEIYELYKKAIKLDSLTSPISEVLSGLAIASILLYGGYAVMNNTSTPGSLVAFISAFVSAYRPFKSMLSLNVNLQEGFAATKRLFQILDNKPTTIENISAQDIEFKNPDIEFKNVGLELGGKTIFTKLDLYIPAGKTTAIVGESGSGKTSILSLLLKFYQANSGQILINGVDIMDIQTRSLRNQIALVTQETFLFDTTVAKNIKYTTEGNMQDIEQASKNASAHEFIMKLPFSYDTEIGFQGYSLSGGQKQRLSLARALLKKAPILILDEATSSLDSHNENMILDTIKTHQQMRTTIIITHRLTSIKDVDHIIVISDGQILEQGTHQQLIDAKQEYCSLYNKQIRTKDKN
jgi:subfamily B ATP-binding cassette protein MsbA